MSHRMQFVVESTSGPQDRTLDVTRVYNLGFTIRDREKMQRHLNEVVGVHVEWPKRAPIIFPISAWATITDTDVPVQYETTSGEVEIVTVVDGTELLIGVGSDHTDRKLEAVDIPWGKQVAPNVLAPVLWRWEEVREHWDQVRLESYADDGSGPVLYQKASVAEFWTPQEMVDSVQDRLTPVDGVRIFFSGTVVSEGETLHFGRWFSIRLIDDVLGREIRHDYTISVLAEEVSE